MASPAPTIVFLISTPSDKNDTGGMYGFMELQILFATLIHLDHSCRTLTLHLHIHRMHAVPTPPPLLPIPSPQHLLPILQTYTTAPTPSPRAPATPHVPTLALLPHVTSTAPLRPLGTHTTNVLSDLCHSLKEVARLCETDGGRGVLGEWLGEEGKGIGEFWEGEWFVE